jgi:hypothetical protein
MKYLRLWVALAALFSCPVVLAQSQGTVTSHAFAVGKGAGQQGFTSLLCASAQIALGQSAADPICQTLSGDVTINSSGVTAIGANKVTLGMQATLAADSVIGNFTGSSATPTARAFPNCTGALIYSTSTHVLGCNVSGGTGTVTSVAAGTGLSASPSPIVSTGTLSCNQATNAAFGCVEVDNTTIKATAGVISTTNPLPAPITASLGSNVTLSATASYFDGPSVAQGSTGTWFASGTVTVQDTAGAAQVFCKLWDGTTVIASADITMASSSAPSHLALSGYLASPAANLRISCRDITSTSGSILFNLTGTSKDSTISAFRIQ